MTLQTKHTLLSLLWDVSSEVSPGWKIWSEVQDRQFETITHSLSIKQFQASNICTLLKTWPSPLSSFYRIHIWGGFSSIFSLFSSSSILGLLYYCLGNVIKFNWFDLKLNWIKNIYFKLDKIRTKHEIYILIKKRISWRKI